MEKLHVFSNIVGSSEKVSIDVHWLIWSEFGGSESSILELIYNHFLSDSKIGKVVLEKLSFPVSVINDLDTNIAHFWLRCMGMPGEYVT